MDKYQYTIGDRVEKLCAVCGEERGHVVASVTKHRQISHVNCPACNTRSKYKSSDVTSTQSSSPKISALYDRTRTYHRGQLLMHPVYGEGEVTAVIELQKIDVLFSDCLRRLIHSRAA